MVAKTGTHKVSPEVKHALRLVTDLMKTPGPSGQEARIDSEICKRLIAAGLPVGAITHDQAHRKSPPLRGVGLGTGLGGQTGNLIVKLPGTVRRGRRLFMAHMDTVPLCVGCKPVRRGGYIVSADPKTALGADNRAGVAIILNALLEILRGRLEHPPLTFLWTVQEEVGLFGAKNVAIGKLGRPAMAFNFDGGGDIVLGATGDYRMDITISGIASHAGVSPEKGVSAISIAAEAVADLRKGGWLGAVKKGSKVGTSNVGIFQGGSAVNVVAPHALVKAEVRSHDRAFRKRMLGEFRKAFQRSAKAVRNDAGKCGSIDFAHRADYESFRLDESTPSVAAAMEAARAVGMSPRFKISNGGLDANQMCAHGITTVTLGTGDENPHTTHERLNVKRFHQFCRAAIRLATDVS